MDLQIQCKQYEELLRKVKVTIGPQGGYRRRTDRKCVFGPARQNNARGTTRA